MIQVNELDKRYVMGFTVSSITVCQLGLILLIAQKILEKKKKALVNDTLIVAIQLTHACNAIELVAFSSADSGIQLLFLMTAHFNLLFCVHHW